MTSPREQFRHEQLPKEKFMSWRETWPSWQPQPGAESAGRGGMSQLGAYDAELTDDPGSWIQPVQTYWSPRLDPRSPEYDPDFAARVEWEEPGPGEAQAQDETPGPQPEPETERGPEPELPF
jgi:hypothetical protein